MVLNCDSKVKIVADKYGNVINISSNPEYGYIRVEQEVLMKNINNWIDVKTLKAIITGRTEDLQNGNYWAGQEIPGKIVIKESHQPFNEEDPDRDLKYAGNTGIPCHVYGEPIYRKSFYTEDMSETHELIQHTNSDDIKEALKPDKVIFESMK
jgi:hypothetical protein